MFHNPVLKTKTLEPDCKPTIINYHTQFSYFLSQRNYVLCTNYIVLCIPYKSFQWWNLFDQFHYVNIKKKKSEKQEIWKC